MTCRQAISLLLTLVSVTLALIAFDTEAAEPPALVPTEEPTKRPYVFPTPIFIPTYPGDNTVATAVPAKTSVATPNASVLPTNSGTYTVQSGDSPWTIAQKVCGNGAKWSSIVQENSIADSTRLRIGTVLKIPSDCSGGSIVQPTAATPVAPTSAAPTPVLVSSSVPISTPISSLRTPASGASSSETNLVVQVGMLAVNVGSGLLFLGSVLAGASAWLVYRRARFVKEMTHMVRRLRVSQKRPPFGPFGY